MEVFVVTDGDYSDYHICAIFSTQVAAMEYAKGNYRSVEVWEVDVSRERLPGCFVAKLNAKGEGANYHEPAENVGRKVKWDTHESCAKWARWGESWTERACKENVRENELIFYGYSLTKNGAIRSANELRRKFLAECYAVKGSPGLDMRSAKEKFGALSEYARQDMGDRSPVRVIEVPRD